MKTLVSIIVPIYQAERYLERCLESVINQTYNELEIILVDDGSKDNSGKICDLYNGKDDRVKVIHKENAGVVSARKSGIQMATGKYIYYVDADDYVELNAVETMVSYAEKYDADIVADGHVRETGNEKTTLFNNVTMGLYYGKELEEKIIKKMLYTGVYYEYGIHQYLWSKLFKRELLATCQMEVNNKITCGDDVACLYPTILKAKRLYVCEDAFYHYIYNEYSMTEVQSRNFTENAFEIYNILKKNFAGSPLKEELLYQLECYMIHMFDVAYSKIITKKVEKRMVLFPFGEVDKGSNIILYGAGKRGEIYYNQIKESG